MADMEKILKDVLYAGVGAVSTAIDTAGDIARHLVDRGRKAVEDNHEVIDTIRAKIDDAKTSVTDIDLASLTAEQRALLRKKLAELNAALEKYDAPAADEAAEEAAAEIARVAEELSEEIHADAEKAAEAAAEAVPAEPAAEAEPAGPAADAEPAFEEPAEETDDPDDDGAIEVEPDPPIIPPLLTEEQRAALRQSLDAAFGELRSLAVKIRDTADEAIRTVVKPVEPEKHEDKDDEDNKPE